jgi:N-acetylornithine carbamoyltransferase
VKRFLSLGDLERDEVVDLVALAGRLETAPEPTALARRIVGLLFLDPSLRTVASMQAATSRLGGESFVLNAGAGTWKLETRSGVVMDGDRSEHVREAIPVLSGYCDALAVRAFASGTDLAGDVADTTFREMAALATVPFVNLESAIDHPCQALADWKTLDELGIPAGGRRGKLVLTWANHPKALPLAVPAATAEMAALRGMEVVVLRPEPFAFPPALAERVGRAAASGGGSFRESTERAEALEGARIVYAKSWSSTSHYGDAAAERTLRSALGDWCVGESWFDSAPVAHLMHCLPVRRNVVVADEVLDSPRSAVVRQAHNRLYAQMAVLHRLLVTSERRMAA